MIEAAAWIVFISVQKGAFCNTLLEPVNIAISIVFLFIIAFNFADVVSITNRPEQKQSDYDKWMQIKENETKGD